MSRAKVTTEDILADAEVAATYFRALLDKGMLPPAALELTRSYVQAYQFSRLSNEEPRKPWEPE